MPNMRARNTIVTIRDGKRRVVQPNEVFDFTNDEVTDISRRAPLHLAPLRQTGDARAINRPASGPSVTGERNGGPSVAAGKNPPTLTDDADDL